MVECRLRRLAVPQRGPWMVLTALHAASGTSPRIGYDCVLQGIFSGGCEAWAIREWLTRGEPMLKPASIRRYLVALSATFAGAWAMDLTGSMIPLALGAS